MAEDLKKLVEKGVSRGYSLEKIQSDFANAGWGQAYLNNIPIYYDELKKKSPVGPKAAGVLPSRQGDTRFSSESQSQQDKYAGIGNIPLSDPLLKKKDGLADSLFKILNQAEKDTDNINKYKPQIQKVWNDYASIERGQRETQNIFDDSGRLNKLAIASLNASAKRNSDRVKEEAKAIAKDDGIFETAARGFYGGILGAADYVANLFDPDTYDDKPDTPDALGLEAKSQLERAQKASLGRKLSAGYTEKQIEDGFIGNFSNGNYGAAFDLFGRDLIEVLPQNAVGFIPYVGLPLMAASAGGQGWQAVKDDDKYSNLEKFIYAPLVGTAEYVTEKLFGMDRKMVQKGLSQAFGKTIKSGADIPKKELGDMLFGGVPKAVRAPLEEGLEEGIVSTFTQTLDKIMADKPFDPVEIAESVMLGAGAGGSTYALVRGGSALLKTPVFKDVYTITNNVNKINELLQSEDIVPEEKEILSNRLNQFKTQLNQLRNEASDYYKPFSQEDKQRTLELNQAITKGMRTYGAMKTPEAKAEVVNTIRQSLAEKAQIEQKYDSTQKQQVPSPVVQGAQPGGVPVQGTSAEAPQAGGVLQVSSEQEEEGLNNKILEVETAAPAASVKPVSTTLNQNNYQGIIGSVKQYVDGLSDDLFKTFGTSRQQVMNGVDSIANVLSSLSKSGRDMPVTIYATEDAWKRGTGGEKLSRGIYVSNEGKISLFLPALVGNTVYHEGLHDVVPKVFGVEGINEVSRALSKAIMQDPALASDLAWFTSEYNPEDSAEEFLVQLASLVSTGDIDIDVKKGLATRFMEAVAKVLGIAGIKMNPSSAQLSKALIEYAERLGAGVALEEQQFDVKQRKGTNQPFNKTFQRLVDRAEAEKAKASRTESTEVTEDTDEVENMLEGDAEAGPIAPVQEIKNPVKYEKIIKPRSSYEISYVNPSNVIDIEQLIDEIVSQGKTVLFWAGDQLGVGEYTDPFTKKKYNLQGGPSYMLNPENVKRGAVWASNIEVGTLNDIILKKKPDYLFIVSGEKTDMMFFNKTVGNIWIDRAQSKFKNIDSFKEAFGKVTKGVEYKTIAEYKSWDELRSQLETEVTSKADTREVNKAKSLIKAIAGMSTASSLAFLKSYGLQIKQFDDLRDGYFRENDFGMLDITTIYKPREIIKGNSNHSSYRNVIMGEAVGVPNRKLSAKDIMTDEFMLGRTKEGFVRNTLPESQLVKAIAPDTPGVRGIARPRKVMRMALEGYNEKPQAMAGQRLFNEPLKDAARIADEYYEQEFGEARPKFDGVKSVDKERAKRISDAYIRMKDDYFDPEVKKAYDAMIDETLKQFDFIVDRGYKVVINNEEPYKNSEDMIADLRDNKVMRIFSTESGFGDEPITDNQRDSNPLLKDSGRKDANGIPLLNNDLFRFVHDFFGHAELGNGFGAVGEENAWNVHSRMYSPLARKAMTSETRGQNSYVNFSGVNDEVFKLRDKAREERKKGNDAEADKLLGEVYEKMKFADQKVGLLPEEMTVPDNFEDKKPKAQLLGVDVPMTKEDQQIVNFTEENEDYDITSGFKKTKAQRIPEKTQVAYKLFRVKRNQPGKLFPLYVRAQEEVPIGEWIDAVPGEYTVDKNGRKRVKSRIGDLAYRPGWHSGDSPASHHIGKRKKGESAPSFRDSFQVWAEVEVGADKDWQVEADARAKYGKDGKKIDNTADLDYMPEGGFYKYKTNPNMTGKWLISGEMKVNRILTDEEVSNLNAEFGVADLPRVKPMDWKNFGFEIDGGEVKPKPKVKRQVALLHGSPYDFEQFKADKIGSGVGAQRYGWGIYFTDIESIAKGYAKDVSASKKYSYEGIDNIDNVSTLPMTKPFLRDMQKSMPNSREEALEWVEKNSRGKSEKVIEELRSFANKLIVNDGGKGFIYQATAHKGKTPDQYTWLEWDKSIDKKLAESLFSNLTKEQYEKAFPFGIQPGYSNGDLYEGLSVALGSDKQASLFLLENGIDGNKYAVTTPYNEKGFNYVVFDENAVTIDKKIKLQKISKSQSPQLEAQMYAYLISISEKQANNAYKLPFTLDEFLSFMSPTFSRQRATQIYYNVSNGIIPAPVNKSVPSIDDAYEASRKMLEEKKGITIRSWGDAVKYYEQAKNKLKKTLIDRQATIKAALLKAGMKNAYNLLVNRAGSGARASYFFSKQEKSIYDGLSKADIENLDKIIMLRRIAEIDKNFDARGEKRPTHPNKLNFESAQIGLADKRKALGDAKFKELNDRADGYFKAFKELLDSQYEEGLIGEDLYNRLKDLDYQPRMFLDHVFEMDELSMRDINLSANQIKKIKEGSDEEIMFYSRFLLAVYSKSTFSRIARNRVNSEIATATDVRGNEEWISKDPKRQFDEVTYFKDGVRKNFYIKSSLKGELDDVNRFGAIPPDEQKYIGLLSGAYLLKLLATRANPLFVFKNVPRDYLHVLFFTNVYDKMSIPMAMYRLAGDAIKGVKSKWADDQDYQDFVKYGGGMEYLSTEGKEGMMTNRSLVNRTIEKLGSAGELSEIAFRLGMYKRFVQESLKNFNGTPTDEQLEQIKVEAVTKAREMIDFAQGGTGTKTLETAVPYINSAFQGFRVSTSYIANNPKQFAVKIGQMTIGLAMLALYNAVMGDDDMDDIPEDVKRKNFIIMTPFTETNDKGKEVRKYIKIAKTQQLAPFIAGLDMGIEHSIVAPFMGREPKANEDTFKYAAEGVKSYLPKDPSKPLQEALSSVPLFSALVAYKANYDTYRDKVISLDYGKVLPADEDFASKNVPYFYKAIGQAVDAGPKRLQTATEKFITSPYSSLLTMGGYEIMNGFSSVYELKGPGGYTPKEQESIVNNIITNLRGNAERVFIGTTEPDWRIYNKKDEIEQINLESASERKGIKLKAKELGGDYFTAKQNNDSKGVSEALKAIREARMEVAEQARKEKNRQNLDYFKSSVEAVMRYGPTFPQEYNDITYATDNAARAKIIALQNRGMSKDELVDYLRDYKRKTGKSIDFRAVANEYNKYVNNEKK